MKPTLAILSLVLFLPYSGEITNNHLKAFDGEWKGTLTYLNYADDETLVNLSLRMVAKYDGKSLKLDYYYDEGNGKVEKRKGIFRLRANEVIYNGKWEKVRASVQDLNTWQLHLKSEGKDNNRPALFKKTIEVSASKIEVTKLVKYLDEEGAYFMRNKHVFVR